GEHHRTSGVPRGVRNVQLQSSQLQRHAVGEVVNLLRLLDRQTVPEELAAHRPEGRGGIGQHEPVSGVDPRRNTVLQAHLASGEDVVEVPVREQHRFRRQPVLLEPFGERGERVLTGIDDDAGLALAPREHVAVGLQRSDRETQDKHEVRPFVDEQWTRQGRSSLDYLPAQLEEPRLHHRHNGTLAPRCLLRFSQLDRPPHPINSATTATRHSGRTLGGSRLPSNEQRRQAAKQKLERQLQRREQQAKRRRTITAGVTIVAVVALVVGIFLCTRRCDDSDASPTAQGPTTTPGPCSYTETPEQQAAKQVDMPDDPDPTPAQGTVEVALETNQGTIPLTLDRAQAPCTVQSFQHLVESEFFDDTECHRLTTTEGLQVLQCGDPTASGSGGPGYSIKDEPPTDLAPAPEPYGQSGAV